MATPAKREPTRRQVVYVSQYGVSRKQIVFAVLAAIISVGAHALVIYLLMNWNPGEAQATEDGQVKAVALLDDEQAKKDQQEKKKEPEKEKDRGREMDLDLSNIDVGNDTNKRNGNETANLDDLTLPLPSVSDATPGLPDRSLTDTTIRDIAPTPGAVPGFGTAGVPSEFGTGMPTVPGMAPGGFNGASYTNMFAGRGNGATRKRLLESGGGNKESEGRVARGLVFLANHQAPDGHWSLHEFNRHAHKKVMERGVERTIVEADKSTPETSRHDDIAGTAFGLLPFLAAGNTHLPVAGAAFDYHKNVKGGLDYLIRRQSQNRNGYFGGENMYSHALATITVCEAYGLTSDPLLKASAQRGLNYIESAQSDGGGWRYQPKESGDTSVTGWVVMALKSGQMAGLNVNPLVLKKVDRYLDSCDPDNKGGYGYQPGSGATIPMTAVGLLCRQYQGVTPRNEGLLNGVERLEKHLPGSGDRNIYYLYYATQVMHHMGGKSWEKWNLGPKGTGKGGIRDSLIAWQDDGKQNPDNAGSWMLNGGEGRLMSTSLALLTLEVYYRHLPLYRRDVGQVKDAK